MRHISIRHGTQAVQVLGQPRLARRSNTIRRREPMPEEGKSFETLQTAWGEQQAVIGQDYVAIEDQGSGQSRNEYPYKIDLWQKNMEPHPDKPGEFRKKTLSRLLEVPTNTVVHCYTIDGEKDKPLEVPAGDFVCIGLNNEVYPMSRETREEQFEWVLNK